MTDEKDEGGRTGDNGAPAGEGIGMGNFDEGQGASPLPSKAPLFAPSALDEYGGSGLDLIGLNFVKAMNARGDPLGKVPTKGWRNCEPMTIEEAKEHLGRGCNVGVRLGKADLVVDVDPRNFGGSDRLAELGLKLGIDWTYHPTVITGSGGKHIYMRKPDDTELVNTMPDFPGIEFKSFGRQVVAAGSAHPETGKPYLWDDDPLAMPLRSRRAAPEALLVLAARPERPETIEAGDYSADQLATMLSGLDVADYADHDRWLGIMMASHHATAGAGRDQFIEWSIGDPAFSDHSPIIGSRWDSLRADSDRRSVTVRTLFKALTEAGRSDLIPRDEAQDDFCDHLPEDALSAEKPDRPGVIDEWVYVIDPEMFVRRVDGKKWKREQWKARYAAVKPDGDVLNAIWRGSIPLRKFEALVYLPGEPEFPDGEGGGRYNIWRQSGVEATPGNVQPFLDHMEHLFADEQERAYVLDYLALLIQSPGRKINFALLVKGAQGTGKSWIGRLMTRIIGAPNVTLPSNTEVMSSWTVWTEGAQLGIIEELMCVGRLDMANRLKPIITEPTLRIEAKGCGLYSIPNHLNLIAFTNHEDAVPIERGDRRWLVVFSAATPQTDAYYERLFAFLDGSGPSAVKQWLLDRAAQLNPKGVAPRTKGKDEMRRLSLGDAEQALADRLDENDCPFDFDLVRLEDVLSELPQRYQKGLRNRVVRWLTDEVGAVQHSRYTKGDRPAYRFWSVRNHDRWAAVGPAERVDAYTQHQRESSARVR